MGFAERLKEIRNENQCTQKKLANYLGLSANCICEWENKRSEPSLNSVCKIAEFFEVSVDYLLDIEDDFGAKVITPFGDTYTAEERQLIEDFRQLTYARQKLIIDNIKAMLPAEAESEHMKIKYKK